MIDNLEVVKKRYDEVTRQLSDPEIFSDQQAFRKLGKEHSELTPIIESYLVFLTRREELRGQEEMLADTEEDPELKALAAEEAPVLRGRLEELEKRLQIMLLPRDPLDKSNVVLEGTIGIGNGFIEGQFVKSEGKSECFLGILVDIDEQSDHPGIVDRMAESRPLVQF